MIGQTIWHYRVLEKLGGGGTGVVYITEDTTLRRFVTLKSLSEDLVKHHEALERFQREARPNWDELSSVIRRHRPASA